MSEEGMTLEEAVDKIVGLFDDGFQLQDVWDAIPAAMELAEGVGGMDGAQKKERVLKIVDKLLDKVNLPGWDWLTKKAIMWFVPGVIDKLVDAAKGRFSF